jgi:hypothetical protein
MPVLALWKQRDGVYPLAYAAACDIIMALEFLIRRGGP